MFSIFLQRCFKVTSDIQRVVTDVAQTSTSHCSSHSSSSSLTKPDFTTSTGLSWFIASIWKEAKRFPFAVRCLAVVVLSSKSTEQLQSTTHAMTSIYRRSQVSSVLYQKCRSFHWQERASQLVTMLLEYTIYAVQFLRGLETVSRVLTEALAGFLPWKCLLMYCNRPTLCVKE